MTNLTMGCVVAMDAKCGAAIGEIINYIAQTDPVLSPVTLT